MSLIICGLIFLLIFVIFRYSVFRVRPKHIAIVNWFGKRWRICTEGLNFKIPLIEKYILYSIELNRIEVKEEAKTADLLKLILEGSVEFVPEASDKKQMFRYDETCKKLQDALGDSIKDDLGILAGTKDAEKFVHEREAIKLIINCKLQLKKMPHEMKRFRGERKRISLEGRLDFYKDQFDKIQAYLDKQTKNPNNRSEIEEAYGIQVKLFNLTNLDYSKETNKVFEEEKQAQAKKKAADAELELSKSFGGLSQKGINAAQVSVGKAKRDVHSIEGKPIEINIGGK